jgi:beta-galactosidase
MQRAHLNVARLGQFAWSRLEPSEGHYDFEWLRRALHLAERHHIAILLRAPTDTPPVWLTERYPQVLRSAAPNTLGQMSFASALYQRLCNQILTRLAQELGHETNVLGWQLPPQGPGTSFNHETRRELTQWLQRRYGTLAGLNQAWGAVQGAPRYGSWDEISLTEPVSSEGYLLDRHRFVTEAVRRFQKDEIDAIRVHADRNQLIMGSAAGLGWSDEWDHYLTASDVDLISFEPVLREEHLRPRRLAAMSDYVRGWKQRSFWMTETTPANDAGGPGSERLDPAELRVLAWQAIGHGADGLVLRPAAESDAPRDGPRSGPWPLYDELGRELQLASTALSGTAPRAHVAILITDESRWLLDEQPCASTYDLQRLLLDYYRPLRDLTHSVDIVSAYAPLDRYQLVAAPALGAIPPALAHHLEEYVRHGGTLIAGPRTALVDDPAHLNREREPGPLRELVGGRADTCHVLPGRLRVDGEGGAGSAGIWAEDLSAAAARSSSVILRYALDSSPQLGGKPAAVRRGHGLGTITYLGTVLDPALMSVFVQQALSAAHATSPFPPLPLDVELLMRVNDRRQILILINHGDVPRTVLLPAGMRDVLDIQRTLRQLTLAPRDVAVLETARAR